MERRALQGHGRLENAAFSLRAVESGKETADLPAGLVHFFDRH
ncbi:hypothetical protein SynA1528_02695 [Synechococcus sp. A15-28]|nr:hypothetical protein SynA1528_02695 [Synechococcus sp. A15-28]